MHPALIYFADDRLSLPEMCAARIDGHLVEVDAAFMPADTVEGPSARATAVSPLIPEGACAMGPTAAWIHGAGNTAPYQHHIQRATSRRLRLSFDTRRVFHDIVIDDGCGMTVGPVTVTDPAHTLFDLLRMCAQHPSFLSWAKALATLDTSLVAKAQEHLAERPRMPGRRNALALLQTLSD